MELPSMLMGPDVAQPAINQKARNTDIGAEGTAKDESDEEDVAEGIDNKATVKLIQGCKEDRAYGEAQHIEADHQLHHYGASGVKILS